MGMTGKIRFAHRRTNDERFESICLQCFRTIGRADVEMKLDSVEAAHTCLPEDVISLQKRMEPKSASGPGAGKKLA